ncbi:hypothetical protein DYB34_005734 [Aphanomyces astaci]|uniref:Uncharacterized protein n=2 Tax=Aphanomyces astaci TaxID=112090 RepID=A0A3R6X2F4_APHAT|nr:hypothetical protein DYB34_005734 [Aphanomyces astaci]
MLDRFHRRCIGDVMSTSFLCKTCCSSRRKPYTGGVVVDNPTEAVYHAKCIGLSPAVLSSLEAYRCNACAIRQHIPPRHPARPNWKQVRAHIARGESLEIHVPGLDELKALVAHGLDVIADVTAFEQSFLDRCALATIAHRMDTLAQELDDKAAAVRRVESLVLLDPAKHKLLPLQWFLHACRLIFCSTPAPRYSQLVVLLNDVALHKLEFPTPELDRFYREIERKLARAVTWVTQVKAMDMKAPSCDLVALQAEAEEISHFLVLPDAAVSNFNLALKFHYQR